jgi:hypothetical protein
MPKFTVLRRVDAYVDYVTEVEANTPQDAVETARESDGQFAWEEIGTQQFDARGFVALDEDGDEIDSTARGDF